MKYESLRIEMEMTMCISASITESIASRIMGLQDKNGCWNVLNKDDRYYPAFNYYVPKYTSTLWTLVLLADIRCDPDSNHIAKPLQVISDHFWDDRHHIYTLGKSHFPIPCLNGNMLYLHHYFNTVKHAVVDDIVDFFSKYQRFDDGDFTTPSSFPYYSNRSCYGKHTCYWGIVKLLKGLSFIPRNRRSNKAKTLLNDCIDFILLHDVCFGSHHTLDFIHKNIQYLTFPNMYQADYLEILWLLKREKVKSPHMKRASDLLKSRIQPDSTWHIERPIRNLVVPIDKKHYGNTYITKRAREVIDFYGS